jgi:hypothetical protein
MKELTDAAKKVDKFLDKVENRVKEELLSLRDDFKAEAKSVSKEAKEAFGSDIPSKKKTKEENPKLLTDKEICETLCQDEDYGCREGHLCGGFGDYKKVSEAQLKKAQE